MQKVRGCPTYQKLDSSSNSQDVGERQKGNKVKKKEKGEERRKSENYI
jgi:hypothetical protein